MSDLSTLHTQAKKLILTIRAGLERLETSEQVRTAISCLLMVCLRWSAHRSARSGGS